MITNNDAQAAVVAWLKANTTVTDLDSNFPDEIREETWQGEDFTYPNIRVSCEITAGECYDDLFCVISSFSEQKSSKESQNIAGVVATELHNKSFEQDSIRFSALTVKTIRAVQEDGIWQAKAEVTGKVK